MKQPAGIWMGLWLLGKLTQSLVLAVFFMVAFAFCGLFYGLVCPWFED